MTEAVSLTQLTFVDFARHFGTTVGDLPSEISEEISQPFLYRNADSSETQQLLKSIHERISQGNFSKAGPEGQGRWQKGWHENLERFVAAEEDVAALVPRYVREGQPLRLEGRYVFPESADFELRWYRIFRGWLFGKVLKPFETVYEFGCGSGYNLAELAEMYPQKRLFGLDWVTPSCEIVDRLGKKYGGRLSSRLFDFFNPDKSFNLAEGSAVLTIGALEQTGTDFGPFLEYLLNQKPALCVHVEPVAEWYDASDPLDAAAARFHHERGYWSGIIGCLKALEVEGRAQIVKTHHCRFGSLYHDGYSQILWKPL